MTQLRYRNIILFNLSYNFGRKNLSRKFPIIYHSFITTVSISPYELGSRILQNAYPNCLKLASFLLRGCSPSRFVVSSLFLIAISVSLLMTKGMKKQHQSLCELRKKKYTQFIKKNNQNIQLFTFTFIQHSTILI